MQGENEWSEKKVNENTYEISSIKKFPEVSRCSRAKQRQRNVQRKSTHSRKFGNHLTVHRPTARPFVRTTGKPMFTFTLSNYFGCLGGSWLHINVEINWQLSKQGIRWPVTPDCIAGSGVNPSRSSTFLSYPLTNYSFSNDRMLKFSQLFKSTGGEDLFLPKSRVGHALRPIFMLWLIKIWHLSSCR